MIQRISKIGLLGVWLLVFTSLVPSAQANTVDFTCSGAGGATACAGSVIANSGVYSTNGITVYNTDGTYTSVAPFASFNLLFNSSSQTISLNQLTGGSDVINGTITSTTALTGLSTSTLVFDVVWNSPLPAAVVNQLGTFTGVGQSAVISLNLQNGQVISADVTITPTPEPGTLALLGSGLLGIGGFLKRRKARA